MNLFTNLKKKVFPGYTPTKTEEIVIDIVKGLLDDEITECITAPISGKFYVTNKKEEIPEQVLGQLKCLTEGFSIANPGEKYQDSDIIELSENLPGRGLIFLAKSKNNLIMVYGVTHGSRFVFINFDETTIKDFWCGVSFGKPEIKSIKQIINRIEYYRDKTWGLNTNIITY